MAFSSTKCTPLLFTSDLLTMLFINSVVRGFFSFKLFETSSNIKTVFCLSDSLVNSSSFCLVLSFSILNSSLIKSDVSFTFFVNWALCYKFLRCSTGGSCCVVWYAINSAVRRLENFSEVIRFFSLSFWIEFPTALSSQFLHVKHGFTPSPNTTLELTFFSQRLHSLTFKQFLTRSAKSPCILRVYFFLLPNIDNIWLIYYMLLIVQMIHSLWHA